MIAIIITIIIRAYSYICRLLRAVTKLIALLRTANCHMPLQHCVAAVRKATLRHFEACWQHCKITVLLLSHARAFSLSRNAYALRQAVYDADWHTGAKEQTKWSRNPRTPDIRVVATLKVRRVERIGQAAAAAVAAAESVVAAKVNPNRN